MKTKIVFSAIALLAASLPAADSSPKETVSKAAQALAEKSNYTWKQTVVVPEGSQFRPGPTDGKTEKSGFTYVASTFGGNTVEIVLQGDKIVINSEAGWQTPDEMENGEGPGRFLAVMTRNFKTPAAQATNLISGSEEIKKDGEVYASKLTEAGAKTLLSFRPRSGGDGPEISDAKGGVKFWIADGVLSKYEFQVSGKISFNGNEREVDRTTTVEIKDVGTTKVEAPEGAKKKLNPEPAPAAK
jgi:hypothetical protein